MEQQMLMNIAGTALLIIIGFSASYLKTRGDILSMVTTLIKEAETMYSDTVNPGGQRFTWVCEKLYGGIPAVLKPFISYQEIERLVQATFDEIEAYANLQLNSFVDKFADEMYNSAAD